MKTAIISLAALIAAPAAMAADIQINYSAAFQEKLTDDYGPREGDKLASDIRKDLERELAKANVDPARIEVTIEDAKPNRPTMQQMSDKPGLDMLRSKSVGGMDLTGVIYDASGNEIGKVEYDWYETNIQNVMASSVWNDAGRASRRFAQELAEELSDQD